MAWWVLDCLHGPEHQNTERLYKWFEDPLGEEESMEAWGRWVNDNRWKNAKGTIELSLGLPQSQRNTFRREYLARIREAVRMLEGPLA